MLTKIRPSVSDTMLANRNQPIARAPRRPSADRSPMCAMPPNRVANTNGAMIIFISFRNNPVRIEKPSVIVAMVAGSGIVLLMTKPTMIPRIIARRM